MALTLHNSVDQYGGGGGKGRSEVAHEISRAEQQSLWENRAAG